MSAENLMCKDMPRTTGHISPTSLETTQLENVPSVWRCCILTSKRIQCTRDVNIIELYSKAKFPITFTFFKLLGRVGEVRCQLDPSPTRARYFFVVGAFLLTRKVTPQNPLRFYYQKLKDFITKNFWNRFHIKISDLPKLRNQEKGVLAKGFHAESSVTPKETKNIPRILGPAAHLALRAPLPREAYMFAKTPF